MLPRFRETIVTLLSEFLPVQPVGELAQIFLDHADRPEFEVREVYRTLPRLREVLGRRLEETRPLAVPQAFCDTIRRGMVYVGATRWLTLPPEVTQGFLERARAKLGSAGGAGVAVVVPDQDVRRPVCSILELEFPNVTVVSAAEYAALVPHPPSEIPQIDVTGIVLPEDDDGEHDGDA